MRNVDKTVQGDIHEVAAHTLPGKLLLVGGVMIESESRAGRWVFAQQLPLEQFLSSAPVDSVRAGGWFAVWFPEGKIDPAAIDWRNKFLVVGKLEGLRRISVKGVWRELPLLSAQCLHIWRTQNFTIQEYPYLPTGYEPLRHDMYCF